MNEDWPAGEHPALGDALEESTQTSQKNKTNDKPSAFDGVADWLCGWRLYWFTVLFLGLTLSDALFCFGLLRRNYQMDWGGQKESYSGPA